MDFDRTYAVGNAFTRGALHFEASPRVADPESLLKGHRQSSDPVSFRRESGSQPQDIMGTTDVALLVISERVIDLFLDERITGWGTYPVQLNDAVDIRLRGYFGLAITGRAGTIDRSLSRIEVKPPPVPQGRSTYAELGLYFDPNSWDGSDLFVPEGSTVICAVERVRRVVEKKKLSNFSFKQLSQYQLGLYSELPLRLPL